MSLEDDIFDVAAKLENQPEHEAFDRITKYMARLEEENDNYQRVFNGVIHLEKALDIVANWRKKIAGNQ
jgi:hypothetical protein